MKVLIKIGCYTVILVLTLYWYGNDWKMAVEISTLIMGNIALIYSTIGIYGYLKKVRFKIQYVSRYSWLKLSFIYIFVYGTFILILSNGLFLFSCIFIPLCLIILLIYDSISDILKK